MNYLEELFYTKEHVWLKYIDGNRYQLGITYFAQDLLGDVVFIDIKSNEKIFTNQPMGIIESVKTASDIIAPVDGGNIKYQSRPYSKSGTYKRQTS